MSLLSVNNFTAPFKNSTHVILLILVAGLFGAYRYSGGAISLKSRLGRAPAQAVEPARIEEELPEEEGNDTADSAPSEGADARAAAPTKRGILDEMIGRRKKSENTGGDSKPSLDEIEKKLGLR